MFIYNGRAGLWDDYCKFLQNRKTLRENERKRIAAKKARRRKRIKDWGLGILVAVATLSVVGICGYFVYWLVTTKGK